MTFKEVSQSLIHQVCYSDVEEQSFIMEGERVAIPYSSGLLFGPVVMKSGNSFGRSQSLIHQVCYSDTFEKAVDTVVVLCRNPLFIRSAIRTCEKRSIGRGNISSQSLIHQVCYSDTRLYERIESDMSSRNPLFIRSAIRTITS